MQFEPDRPCRRHRLVGLGQRLLVALPLPLDRAERGVRVDEPWQPHARGAHHRRVGIGGDPDRRKGLLHRPDRAGRVVHLEEAALMGDLVLGPQPLDQFQ